MRNPTRWLMIISVCATAGCMPELRNTLAPDEARSFRSQAMQTLKQAVLSEEPVLRMQALEAFQDVAPDEGMPYIVNNIDNGYAGVSFAALMALGTVRDTRYTEKTRIRAEDSEPNVRIAALFALHRLGDMKRTGEIGDLLLNHPDPRVRSNAAIAIGRLGEPGSIRLLQSAIHREKKDIVKLQIREALAILGDKRATEELIFAAHSAVPDQATLALMFLANAKCDKAEEVFRYRLHHGDQPEIRLQAALGLGRLGIDAGYDLAAAHLFYRSPVRDRKNDSPDLQIARVRSLAALALEAIHNPEALGPLKQAFEQENQPAAVRLAIARAVIGILRAESSAGSARPAPRPAKS